MTGRDALRDYGPRWAPKGEPCRSFGRDRSSRARDLFLELTLTLTVI